MLQIIIQPSNDYSMAEQVQMAIEGGCTWVEVHAGENPDGDMVTELTEQIVPMCRESGIILTLANDVELAQKAALHGVYISAGQDVSMPALREQLGAEAIIGTEVSQPQAAIALDGADIDFVRLPQSFSVDDSRTFVEAVRAAGCRIPIVLQGEFTDADAGLLPLTGASGLASYSALFAQSDPVEAVRKAVEALKA